MASHQKPPDLILIDDFNAVGVSVEQIYRA